jgi:hypothetical protein
VLGVSVPLHRHDWSVCAGQEPCKLARVALGVIPVAVV